MPHVEKGPFGSTPPEEKEPQKEEGQEIPPEEIEKRDRLLEELKKAEKGESDREWGEIQDELLKLYSEWEDKGWEKKE